MSDTRTRKAEFRPLYAEEIDVRVQSVGTTAKGGIYAILLLYKDARVDMTLLDEKYGLFGWQREHVFREGKNYCKVSVCCPDTGNWVSKEDVGTESFADEVKGAASDAFKRACVNIGIGRELYTAPDIFVDIDPSEVYEAAKDKHGKSIYRLRGRVRFSVSAVEYDDAESVSRKIVGLAITDQNGRVRYEYGKPRHKQPQTAAVPVSAPAPTAPAAAKSKRITMRTVEMPDQCTKMLAMLESGYRANPTAFSVGDYLRGHGFEIDEQTLTAVQQKFTNHIIEKGL